MSQYNDEHYHTAAAYVYIGNLALTESEIWDGVDHAETAAGISLTDIHGALTLNWSATVVALALRNIAALRTLIDEAEQRRL